MKETCDCCQGEIDKTSFFKDRYPVTYSNFEGLMDSCEMKYCLGCTLDALRGICKSGTLIFKDGSSCQFYDE